MKPQTIMTAVVALLSLAIFAWPLLISTDAASESGVAQTAFLILIPVLLALILSGYGSGALDSRQIALLGVLTAVNSVIRMLGAGLAGVETVFFLLIIAGFVFRASFGFLLGASTLLVSGLLSGGVGPWLPFQMLAAGLVGFCAGLLPRTRNRRLGLAILSIYAVVAAYAYGGLMTLWNWPYLAGIGTQLSYQSGAGILTNLARFLNFEIATGGLLWDTGRAITTVVLLLLTAPTLLTTLEREARRASFQKVERA